MCEAGDVSSATLRIRKARPEDRDAICRVHRTAIAEICRAHYAPHAIAAWTGRLFPDIYLPVIAAHHFIVAEHEDMVVGFAQLDVAASAIEAVYVDPRHTRHGVGTALLGALEAHARGSGLTVLHLEASLNSVRFYEACGFSGVADALHELTPGIAIACVVMRKAIGAVD